MIPKLVHRVWLGPNPPPAEHDYREQWEATHPDWHLVTWTDTEAGALELVNRAEYDAAPTYVHRADLILPEVVYMLGGVAVGYDMEPLRSLEPLTAGHDCWCTPDADGFAGGAFFGAVPRHPAIRHVLDTIRARVARDGWHPSFPNQDTGPWAWGEAFGRFHEHCADFGMDVLGDYRTAYPIRYWEKKFFDRPAIYAHRTRHSIVVHRFAGSWLNPDLDLTVRRPA